MLPTVRIGLYSLCKKIPRLLFPTFTTLTCFDIGVRLREQSDKIDEGLLRTRALTATNGRTRLTVVYVPVE